MANLRGPTFARSSPHSSEEASHHDTPSTNFTAFSSESAGTATGPRPKFNMLVAEADEPLFAHGGNVGTSSNDPFINLPTPTSARSQLSPTADVFTPGQSIAPGFAASSSVTNNASNFTGGGTQSVFNGFPVTHGRVSSLVANSTPEAAAYPIQTQYGAIGDYPQPSNVSKGKRVLKINVASANVQEFQHFRDGTVCDGTFTIDEPTTRAFMVTNLPLYTDFCRAAVQVSALSYPSVTGFQTKASTMIVEFTNYSDAKAAYANITEDKPHWRLVRLSPKSYAIETADCHFPTRDNVAFVSNFEGEVIVSVFFNGRDNTLRAKYIFEMLQHTLSTFGAIKAFHSMPYQQGNVREIRVEYYDTRHADNAVRSLDLTQLGSVVVSVDHHKPDVQFHDTTRPSVTGRSTVPFNDPAAAFGCRGGPYLSPGNDRSRHGRSDASGNHNQVDIARIQLGLDVRTTIMLRNIPNKVNQAMLKMILDETSLGDYDFMYLRIDFANNCNVGYAFINFIDALAIIAFARARAGQRWNRFNSDKVAEISYATIQGKDCLVQKFRNSSVMLECPTFRPKLYVPGKGHDAGEEEPFPPPDNPSKMRRSVENAEHVGLFRYSSWKHKNPLFATHAQNIQHLVPAPAIHMQNIQRLFAPRQGQLYREEQRRRRSQFDRGTPGAEFEAHTQHLADPALSAYPSSSSYPVTMNPPQYNHSHYDGEQYVNDQYVDGHYINNHCAPDGPGPSTWYLDNY